MLSDDLIFVTHAQHIVTRASKEAVRIRRCEELWQRVLGLLASPETGVRVSTGDGILH